NIDASAVGGDGTELAGSGCDAANAPLPIVMQRHMPARRDAVEPAQSRRAHDATSGAHSGQLPTRNAGASPMCAATVVRGGRTITGSMLRPAASARNSPSSLTAFRWERAMALQSLRWLHASSDRSEVMSSRAVGARATQLSLLGFRGRLCSVRQGRA